MVCFSLWILSWNLNFVLLRSSGFGGFKRQDNTGRTDSETCHAWTSPDFGFSLLSSHFISTRVCFQNLQESQLWVVVINSILTKKKAGHIVLLQTCRRMPSSTVSLNAHSLWEAVAKCWDGHLAYQERPQSASGGCKRERGSCKASSSSFTSKGKDRGLDYPLPRSPQKNSHHFRK